MRERIEQELAHLRRYYRELTYEKNGRWVLLRDFPTPDGTWDHDRVSVAFQIPPGYPGQKPYGFYVHPRIRLRNGGLVKNVTDSSEPPFPGEWMKFSWDVPDWRPTADLQSGSNLLNYVLTFRARLEQGA